jgi:hypothetical protein
LLEMLKKRIDSLCDFLVSRVSEECEILGTSMVIELDNRNFERSTSSTYIVACRHTLSNIQHSQSVFLLDVLLVDVFDFELDFMPNFDFRFSR